MLVIGLGQESRGDDRAGREVARRLGLGATGPLEVRLYDGDPTGLLDLWEAVPLVLVADATRTHARPGSVLRVEVSGAVLPSPLEASSSHGLSLAHAVGLGQALGRMPGRLVIYGVEAGRMDPGSGLSPEVDEAVDRLVGQIRREAEQELRVRASEASDA